MITLTPYPGFPKPLANGASHSCRDLRSPSERQVPGNRPFKSLGQGCGSRESENILGPTHIQASARLSIRMAEIETNSAGKPHLGSDQLGQTHNGDFATGTDIDGIRGVEMLSRENDGAGGVLDVKEFPSGSSSAPNMDFSVASLAGLNTFAD